MFDCLSWSINGWKCISNCGSPCPHARAWQYPKCSIPPTHLLIGGKLWPTKQNPPKNLIIITLTYQFRVSSIDDDTGAIKCWGHLTGGARRGGNARHREAWPRKSVQGKRIDITVVDKISARWKTCQSKKKVWRICRRNCVKNLWKIRDMFSQADARITDFHLHYWKCSFNDWKLFKCL